MNVTEANAVMRVLSFLAGDVDHCDETTRAALARDCLWLQTRAYIPLKAGLRLDEATWDEQLALISFEPTSYVVPVVS